MDDANEGACDQQDDDTRYARLFQSEFFTKLELHDPTAVLPKYLKYLLIIHGFDNYHSFVTIDESDMAELERFGQEELQDHLRQNVPFLTEKRMKDFTFESWLTGFKICRGHRKLMAALSIQCKNIKSQFISAVSDSVKPSIQAVQKIKKTPQSKASEPKSDADLLAITNRSLKINFADSFDALQVTSASASGCFVICNICSERMSVSQRARGSATTWVVSNVLRHTRSKHVNDPLKADKFGGRVLLQPTLN